MYDDLTLKEKAELIRLGVSNGIYSLKDIKNIYNNFANGGSIHIKPENRGKFTALKERTGHNTSWFIKNGTPAQKKMAVFANNARKWKHDEGGDVITGQSVLDRANLVYSNYEDAKDFDLSPLNYKIRKCIGRGLSNCTLTATQWIDPTNPIKSAKSIINDESLGYSLIKPEEAKIGDLMITMNPLRGTFHTMLIEGFDEIGLPILRYSNGGHDLSSLKTGITAKEYHKKDNKQGGKHTYEMFYRYNRPINVLPEITVTPNKKDEGGYVVDKKYDKDSDTQYLNTEEYEPWFPDKHKEDYGFNIGQWIGPMHVREMQLGNAKNHSEASSYLVDSNKEFINDYISRLSAAHPELSSAALSNIRTALSPESISFVSDDAFAKSNTAGETTARREGDRIIPEIRLRDNIGYYDTQNKSRDLSNIFRHELHHFLRKYQGNYTNPIFNPEERETLNSAYFAVPSTLERGAENARLRSIIAQNNGNVWGKDLDNVIDNLSYEDLLSYISNMEGYMKDSESLYTAPNKEAVSNLQSKIAEKDKERETILNTVIYPKYLIPYEDGVYIKDNIINQYKTREGEEASVVRDAMFKEWDENKDLKRIAYERKALEEDLKKALMAPNKERLDSVKKALKQVAQNNNGFLKPNNAYLAALGGNLKSTGGPRLHENVDSNWLPDFVYNPSIQSDNGRQLVQSVLQDENVQKAVQQKALQRQAEIEAQRKAVSEIYNGMPNPGAGYVSGTDPLLQAVVDMTPAGDAEMAIEATSKLINGNLKEAGLLGATLLLPNVFNKGIKEWRKGRKLSKELSETPLVQTVSDDKINNWLAERWYRNETHELPPRIVERFSVDPYDFDKYGIPLSYKLSDNLPGMKRNPGNTLIHVDNRIPLTPKSEGFAPVRGNGEDIPAIWWQRNYPYYTEPTSLNPIGGHTLKVKESSVKTLEPIRRYEGAPGPVVVTEGILPYSDIESGIKINPEKTWFEKEVFAPSRGSRNYFGPNLPWFTYSTGGPIYPFSFNKNPLLKTPIVRY